MIIKKMIIDTKNKKKTIKNIFNFIYFLRYLIIIFVLFTILFFLIPKFFNFNQKINTINQILTEKNQLSLIKTGDIKYEFFPHPMLEIENVSFTIKGIDKIFVSEKLILKINIASGYKIDDLRVKKIKFIDTAVQFSPQEIDKFILFLENNNGKIFSENLDITILKNKKDLLNINNINLKSTRSNFIEFDSFIAGYKIYGNFLNNKDKRLLNFKIKDLGINAKINFNKSNIKKFSDGEIKLKILKNNLIVNYIYDKKFIIKESRFKNQNTLLKFDGEFEFAPYFNFKINSYLKKIDYKKINFDLINRILNNKEMIKKINGNLKLNHNLKDKFLKQMLIDINLKNGEVDFQGTKIELNKGVLLIDALLKDLGEYKELKFILDLSLKNKNDLLKYLKIPPKNISSNLDLNLIGHYNINANKFYFDSVSKNKNSLNIDKIKFIKENLEKNLRKFKDNHDSSGLSRLLKEFIESI